MNEAQKRLREIENLKKALAEEEIKLLSECKESDLELVRKLCEQHGFTATDLKGYIKVRAGRKPKDPNAPKRTYTRKAKPEEQAS